ncbi:hypothetical protein [Micromonospora sp. NPDC005087]|uniref:hypothetical protein n=1 Tax=Micromonospora sp. NPDC005087 TaxID=3364225 RepID=UPI0036A516A5
MSEARVAKHTFVYNGERYFRDKSEDVLMCSYGEKEDPLGTKASLNVTNHVDRALLKGKVRYVTTADVEWTRQARADVEAEGQLKYFTLDAAGTATFSYEKAKSGRLKLAKFVIDEGPLQSLLNNDATGARRFLAQEGKDGRIVSTIWVVVEGKIAESFAAAGTSTGAIDAEVLSAAKLRLTVKKSGSASGTTAIVLEEGTTFAYLMHRVQKWNKDKTHVEELDIDAKGLN